MTQKTLNEPLSPKRHVVSKELELDIAKFLLKKTVRGYDVEPTASQVAIKSAKLIKDIVEANEKNVLGLVGILNLHNKYYSS